MTIDFCHLKFPIPIYWSDPLDLMAEMTAGPKATKRSLPHLQVLTSGLQINPSGLDKRGQVKDYWLCATKHYISLETSLDIQQIDSIRLQFILFLWKRERSLQETKRYFKCHYNPIQRTKLFVRITIIILRFISRKYIISKIP